MEPEKELKEKRERFCQEYIKCYNATAAAIAAGYSETSAYAYGYELRHNPQIKKRIKELQGELAEIAGISPLMVVNELAAIAFSNMSDMFSDWVERKAFDDLTDVQKKSIKSIESRTETRTIKIKEGQDIDVEIEMVKITLHDKLKAIEIMCKNLGFNAADTLNLNHSLPPDASIKVVVNNSGIPMADSENEEPTR